MNRTERDKVDTVNDGDTYSSDKNDSRYASKRWYKRRLREGAKWALRAEYYSALMALRSSRLFGELIAIRQHSMLPNGDEFPEEPLSCTLKWAPC